MGHIVYYNTVKIKNTAPPKRRIIMNTEKETVVLMGSSEFHERLIFTERIPTETMLNIQSYCDELVTRLNNPAEDEDIKADAYLIVDGVRADITDADAFLSLAEKLWDAESCEFDVYLNAHYRSAVYNADPEDDEEGDGTGEFETWFDDGLHPYLDGLMDVVDFEYRKIAFYPNSGEFSYCKIKNGEYVDIDSLANKDFPLTVKDSSPWYSYSLGLGYGDDSITEKQAEKVHEIVNKYLPDDQAGICEEYWEDDNSVILCDVQWFPESFVKVSKFLEELNAVVEIPEDKIRQYPLTATTFNAWFDMKNFGIIFMEEVDGNFVLLGTDF